MNQEDKNLIKEIKTSIAKPNTKMDKSKWQQPISEKASKTILQLVHKTLTSPKATEDQKEAGKLC
jgi:hypothetical protein